MNRTLFLAFSLIFLFTTNIVLAQSLSKTEKKELKKELKAYKKDPEQYAKVKKQQKKELSALLEDLTSTQNKLSEAQTENEELKAKLNLLQAKYNDIMISVKEADNMPNGTIYQVQMGLYEYLDLQSFNKRKKYIKAEEVGNAKRYTIGYFDTVEQALEFRKDMKTLGIKDAFVTQYIDGERVMDFEAVKEKK